MTFKKSFLLVIDLRSSIVLTFSIAVYPVCLKSGSIGLLNIIQLDHVSWVKRERYL